VTWFSGSRRFSVSVQPSEGLMMRFQFAACVFSNLGAEGVAFHHDLSLTVLPYVIAAAGSRN
jgi:hypothetical protein